MNKWINVEERSGRNTQNHFFLKFWVTSRLFLDSLKLGSRTLWTDVCLEYSSSIEIGLTTDGGYLLRPCVRQKFLIFLFPQVLGNSEKSSEIISCFWVKKPVFGSKRLEKARKKFRKVPKQGFPNILNFRKFWKLFYFKLSENYKKMTLNLNFENREKLVPTRKLTQKFG